MNREIRFRVWDNEAHKMRMPGKDVIFISTNGIGIEGSDEYTPMQYAGLHDRNGVEIYEGDIVDLHSWKPGVKEAKRQIIKWINSGMFMERLDGSVSGHAELPNHRLEVIGNIYEDPELLKEVR